MVYSMGHEGNHRMSGFGAAVRCWSAPIRR
jgi:hypothetical protein